MLFPANPPYASAKLSTPIRNQLSNDGRCQLIVVTSYDNMPRRELNSGNKKEPATEAADSD